MEVLLKTGGNNMRKFILLFLIILINSSFILSQTSSTISIYSQPSESLVQIDSVLIGKTPLKNHKITPGRHYVIISPPQSGMWNFEDKSYDVFIEENEDKSLNVTFFKPVFVNSIPYAAHLKSADIHIGIAPVYLPFEIIHLRFKTTPLRSKVTALRFKVTPLTSKVAPLRTLLSIGNK